MTAPTQKADMNLWPIGNCQVSALIDKTGQHDLGQLRSLQDWFLKYELKSLPNVAEVASVGGMVRQYQILLDPDKLAAYGIPHTKVVEAIQKEQRSICIAPEGTRTLSPKLGPFKKGAFHLAMQAGVPIVPCWVCNITMRLGFGPALVPSGDYAADLGKIAAYMRSALPDEPRFKALEAQAKRLLKGERDA